MAIHISYWGSPLISASFLRSLIQDKRFIIDYVVTQPDKARSSRGREILPSAVKKVALEYNIPIFSPETLKNDEDFLKEIKNYNPLFHVVFAYGKIIPESIFNGPPKGSVNFHASLLPFLRGAAPVEFSLMQGHTKTGWTLQKINNKLDSGDILSTIEESILWNDSKETLFTKLEVSLLSWGNETLNQFAQDLLVPITQNHDLSTYCSKIYSETGKIDWKLSSDTIRNLTRGLGKTPGVYCIWKEQKIKLFIDYNISQSVIQSKIYNKQQPGFAFIEDNTLWVVCGDKIALPFSEIQPAGKKIMIVSEFKNGYTQDKEIIFT